MSNQKSAARNAFDTRLLFWLARTVWYNFVWLFVVILSIVAEPLAELSRGLLQGGIYAQPQQPQQPHALRRRASPDGGARPAAPPAQAARAGRCGLTQPTFEPPPPRNIEETGLNIGFLSDLVMKIMYFEGFISGANDCRPPQAALYRRGGSGARIPQARAVLRGAQRGRCFWRAGPISMPSRPRGREKAREGA